MPAGAGEGGAAASGGVAPRPGDVARAALRSAVSARRGEERAQRGEADGGDGGVPAGAAEVTAAEAGGPSAPQAPSDVRDAARAGGRPGDAARDALRAARQKAAQAREEAQASGTSVTGPSRRHRPAGPTDSRTPDDGRTGQVDRARVARDVRELLANGFRMPTTAHGPEGAPDADGSEATPDADGPEQSPQADARAATSAADAPDEKPDADTPAHEGTPSPSSTPSLTPALTPTSAPAPAPTPTLASGSVPIPTPPPPSAIVPRTMATPHRDGELRRTFPALPRRASREGGGFAETWWGNAWVAALEGGALDVKRLARGRGYAERGQVDAITVTPGLVLAYVRGSRPRPYRVQVRLRTLGDADWERFLDAAADRPGHIAALLDKELPRSLADCGVPLLPGPGDLAPRCSCPDSGHPCKHAAALCYQTARLLDADPFVLLLLRGRGERELLDALSRLSAARAARAAREQGPAPLPGVRASDAFAPRRLPPLPPPLPTPPHPEQPPVYPAAPGGPDPFALDQLATDAAARAHALLGTGRDPVGELTLWQDAVRLAAARPGSGLTAGTRALYASLASAAGRTPAELARAVAAWRQGGLDGLTVLEEPWDPPAGRFDRARPLLLAADLPAFRPWRNRLTHPGGHVQLRLGREGLWYAYESEAGQDDWWPRGTPDLDPVGALTGLGTPDDL
ncbi:SWIM zinc finger family protein [Streptomyces sp. NPDC054794]